MKFTMRVVQILLLQYFASTFSLKSGTFAKHNLSQFLRLMWKKHAWGWFITAVTANCREHNFRFDLVHK
jgi:hypothetical protein